MKRHLLLPTLSDLVRLLEPSPDPSQGGPLPWLPPPSRPSLSPIPSRQSRSARSTPVRLPRPLLKPPILLPLPLPFPASKPPSPLLRRRMPERPT